MYANRLSAHESDNITLQISISNFQVELKKLKVEMYNLKKSSHSVSVSAAYRDNGRMVPR